jgi:hypothetical protein
MDSSLAWLEFTGAPQVGSTHPLPLLEAFYLKYDTNIHDAAYNDRAEPNE